MIRVIALADRVYWRLYAARQELEVRKQQHELANTQLERAKRRLEAGEDAEIEVTRAEAGVAEGLEAIIIVLFAVLFCWVSAGFWTAITGFLLLAFHGDRFVISRRASPDAVIPDDARTAIVMPICNEDVPLPYAANLEKLTLIDAERIVEAVRKVCYRS